MSWFIDMNVLCKVRNFHVNGILIYSISFIYFKILSKPYCLLLWLLLYSRVHKTLHSIIRQSGYLSQLDRLVKPQIFCFRAKCHHAYLSTSYPQNCIAVNFIFLIFWPTLDHLSNFNVKGSSVFCCPGTFSLDQNLVFFLHLKSLFTVYCLFNLIFNVSNNILSFVFQYRKFFGHAFQIFNSDCNS